MRTPRSAARRPPAGRGLVLPALACAALLSACGGSIVHESPAHPVIYTGLRASAQRSGLITRTVDGSRLVVPTALATAPLHVLAPPMLVQNIASASKSSARALNQTSAIVQNPKHVELIAQGEAGRSVTLFWQMTCGYQRSGRGSALVGGVGGELLVTSQLPLVVRSPLPNWTDGLDQCYVAVDASTPPTEDPNAASSASLAIVNH